MAYRRQSGLGVNDDPLLRISSPSKPLAPFVMYDGRVFYTQNLRPSLNPYLEPLQVVGLRQRTPHF